MSDGDDVLKNAGRFFAKLGGQIKDGAQKVGEQVAPTLKKVSEQVAPTLKTVGDKVAQTSKQVTGLGRGEVKLELAQTKFNPGDTFTGRLVLGFTEPVDAKQIVVELRARQRFVAGRNAESAARTHQNVYELVREIAGTGTYQSEDFTFELTVPSDALELRPSESAGANPLVDAARTVASAVMPNAGPIEWDVTGKVVISWGRDLTTSVDIVVVR